MTELDLTVARKGRGRALPAMYLDSLCCCCTCCWS